MLEVSNLVFGYGRRIVGSDISLAVEPGEVLALLGPNGAGKTSLFKTMLGLLKPVSGHIVIDGEDLERLNQAELARRVAFVPQAHSALFPYDVIDIVLMARASRLGVFEAPGARDREIAMAALSSLGMAALANRPYTEISGGERQIVLIARALAQQAKYLVLDEPTASLDYGNQMRVLGHIRKLAKSGMGVVLSTHNPDHVFMVADRVALMHEHRIVALGAPRDVLTPEALKRLYDIDVVIGAVPGSGSLSVAPTQGA